MLKVICIWTLVVMSSVVTACTSVPGTGRERLNFMPSAQMQQLGQDGFRSILNDSTVVETGPDVTRVESIADRIVRSARSLYPGAELPDQWVVVVIEDDSPNAFALPGGRIGIHTGMIELAGSDDDIAIVIGHEVAHVMADHAGERMSQALMLAGGLALGDAALRDQNQQTRTIILSAMGAGAMVGISLPYSRLHETEADELGLMIAAHAGFDPRGAIGLWERMAADGPSRVEFLSTHPDPSSRIDDLRRIMPSAMAMYRAATR